LAHRRASQLDAGPPVALGGIRRRRRVSQEVLAVRIGTSQGDLSRLERRSDLLVSTLTRYIAALGGSLELWARFPGSLIRVNLTGRTRRVRRRRCRAGTFDP
ncbi:MAG TPA: helix-turn-helix transcriptional regulator, partial [Gemmatimonadales bacterium]|nr:helix-turn-helix transcriptional regulator [Gemmatimonadales bacterium]